MGLWCNEFGCRADAGYSCGRHAALAALRFPMAHVTLITRERQLIKAGG
ncbi:MAG TPA: hypothetical protein VGC69_12210 [Bordetella sp.]